MPNWYAVASPREYIKKGNIDEAKFAPELNAVVSGEASPGYNNPHTFIQETYLTKGLKDLLKDVCGRLRQGEGPSVTKLQAHNGAGKTHALILLYHYLQNGSRIEGSLPESVEPLSVNISAVVGSNVNPPEGFQSDEHMRDTLWGEIGYQLGGKQTCSRFDRHDKERIVPGTIDVLKALEPLQPFVILLDEVMELLARVMRVPVRGSNPGAQALSFLQSLTEAVHSLDHGLLVVTLPQDVQEYFVDNEFHRRLMHAESILKGIGSTYIPIKGSEVYSIFRNRLFDAPDDSEVRSIVDAYVQIFQRESDSTSRDSSAEIRWNMNRAYPFHPSVINLLYQKWTTFDTFQRTCGALHLLAHVVLDLYQRRKGVDLILPGDTNLEEPSIKQKFLQHIRSENEHVISSDIAGDAAKSQQLDEWNEGWNDIAQRIATSIFLHSFSANQNERGVELSQIRMEAARPDTPTTLIDDVLRKLLQNLQYLRSNGEEYLFSEIKY